MNARSPAADGVSTHRDERGLAESTQWVVVVPVLLALVLGLVQVGVWLHGRSVASSAAAAGADRMAGGGSRQDAEAVARAIASAGGLLDVSLDATERDGLVTVSVSGSTQVFFDVGQSRVIERAVLPAEEVTRP